MSESSEDEAFKVFVRVRPLMSREQFTGAMKGNSRIIKVVDDDND